MVRIIIFIPNPEEFGIILRLVLINHHMDMDNIRSFLDPHISYHLLDAPDKYMPLHKPSDYVSPSH